jgi:hypothetical protein
MDPPPRERLEDGRAFVQVRCRDERFRTGLDCDLPPQIVVDGPDVVALGGEMHGGRPAEIAIAAEYQNAHD